MNSLKMAESKILFLFLKKISFPFHEHKSLVDLYTNI